MGRVIEPTILRPHQFVGYWGFGQRSELETKLAQIVDQVNRVKGTKRSSLSFLYSLDQTSECIWGTAYLGLSQSECPFTSQSTGVIAAVSASGLISFGHGSSSPDAWAAITNEGFVLGREPFGRVPLYWTQIEEIIWFSSHLQLLLPVVETPQISIRGLYGYSCFSYIPTPLTPVDDIFSVPAGTEQTWTAKDTGILSPPISARSHEWQEALQQQRNESIAINQLQTLLQDAIQTQIQDLNDDPVGVFLSGGLDSSIVAALLVQAGVKVRAYTLDFGNVESEYPYAERVAEFLNIPLVKVDASPQRIRQALIPAVQALDLPFGDGVTVPLFLLNQAASQETHVIFNGEGGDQLFAGWTNKPLIAATIYQPDHSSEHPTQDIFTQHYLRTFHRLWGYEAEVFQPEVLTQIQQINPQGWLQDALDPTFANSLLHRLRRATLMLKGAQNIHPRATNLGSAHGLMVRSPFCHLPLAEWAFQLAGELHLHGSCEKYILKRAVEGWLPPDIVWRQKRGMGVPLTAWCLNELWQNLGWLNPTRLKQEGIWNPQIAVQIAAGEVGVLQGRRIGEILWLLLIWQIWSSTVLNTKISSYSLNHPFWLPSWLGRYYLQLRRSSHQW